MNDLVSTDDLRQWLKLEQAAAIEKRLREWGIVYRPGPGGPVTTQKAIDEAFAHDNKEKYVI